MTVGLFMIDGEKPTLRRKEREKEARREAILDAAGRVFALKGYHQATLEEIAAEAELAKGTIYNYYRDKSDLFVSLIERGHARFRELLPELVRHQAALAEFIRHLITHSLKYMMAHKYLFSAMLSPEWQWSTELRERICVIMCKQVDAMAGSLAEALGELPESKDLNLPDRLTGARMILASIRHLSILNMNEASSFLPEEEIKNFSRLLCRALSTESSR